MLVPQGGGPAGDTHALFNADAEMQIVEPRGIDFMNVVRDVHGRMGRDPSGTVFCLQIQFVGHRDDGSEGPLEVELVGVQLKLADLTAKFDVQGGTYDLIMFGIANGVTRTGHTVKALDQAQLPTNGSLKLEIALRELQDNINENYNARFKKETMRRGHPPGGKVQYAFLAGDYTGCDMD